jgi:hypothetical protein
LIYSLNPSQTFELEKLPLKGLRWRREIKFNLHIDGKEMIAAK